MSLAVEKLRLREVYHHLLEPLKAAKEVTTVMRARARAFQWSMLVSSPTEGDNGDMMVYPFWGISKSFE